MESMDRQGEEMNRDLRPMNLEKYLKLLGKKMKSAKGDFWREMRLAEEAFRREMIAAMREYEKAEYPEKRIPGALAEAGEKFDERYNIAYENFGKSTKQALAHFQKTIEELVGA